MGLCKVFAGSHKNIYFYNICIHIHVEVHWPVEVGL